MGTQLNPNQEDWRELYKKWAHCFLLFARQQTRNPADAEDVVQEAFVRVWVRREQFPKIESGLVFMQIRRFAIDRFRQEHRRQQREQAYADINQSWFVEAEKGSGLEGVERILKGLPPEQQEVLVLKIWGDQTFESIGRALDISPNTAASRYRYGLEHLRRELNVEESK